MYISTTIIVFNSTSARGPQAVIDGVSTIDVAPRLVLPAGLLAAGVALTVWNLLYLTRYGLTRGGQIALRYSVLYATVVGALTAATYVAIRNGDRDPAWRRAACWRTSAMVLTGSAGEIARARDLCRARCERHGLLVGDLLERGLVVAFELPSGA